MFEYMQDNHLLAYPALLMVFSKVNPNFYYAMKLTMIKIRYV